MDLIASFIINFIFHTRYFLFKLESKIYSALKISKENLIKDFLKESKIENYIINEDGSIDIDGFSSIYINLNDFPIKIKSVQGTLIYHAEVSNLKGCPQYISGNFLCRHNKLNSFEGGPKFIGGSLICDNNNITSFEGFPEKVNGVAIGENPVYEVFNLHPCLDFIELINEYDAIRGNKIVEIRLRQALEDSNCGDIPQEFKFNNYELI